MILQYFCLDFNFWQSVVIGTLLNFYGELRFGMMFAN